MMKITKKNIFKRITTLTALVIIPFAHTYAKDVIISAEKLPDSVQTFIKENFSEQKIASVIHDKEWISSNTYEVRLDNGTKIEFSEKGEWIDIEGKSKNKLPDSVIPKAILSYIQKNYEGKFIEEISRKAYGYEVELNGDIEIRFNKEGDFLSVDD